MYDHALYHRMKEGEKDNLSFILVEDEKQCDREIKKSDVVIGVVPDVMLLKIAETCIVRGRTLISPAKLTRQMFAKKIQAEENDALVLLECGFTPGLDHLTAKKMIDHIHAKGGKISSFETYSGSLVADSSIDNPLELKLTASATELLNLGRGNNRYIIDGALQHVPYHFLMSRAQPMLMHRLPNMVSIPDDDALYCRKLYDLAEAKTVIKGRIVRKGFEKFWDVLIKLGMTNTTNKVEMLDDPSFINYLRSLLPHSPVDGLEHLLKTYVGATDDDIEKLKWLGLFEDAWFEGVQSVTPSHILQYLLERKLSMAEQDKDCIIIHHELGYSLNQQFYRFKATFLSEGTDQRHSALAKAVGWTVGAAAKAVLVGNIKLKGVHTPVRKEVYDPVLNELEDLGIAFHVEEKILQPAEAGTMMN
jgi:saccharopine dehydrogenase-like NADP-dependent oxidoreductase